GGEQPGEGVPGGVSKAFFGAGSVADGFGGRAVSNDAVYRARGGRAAVADRMRERGEFTAGAGDDEGEGVCNPVGAGGEPLEIGAAVTGREPDAGRRRRGSWDAAGVGRIEIIGGADAAEHYS